MPYPWRNIVHQQSYVGVTEVHGNEAAESLLAGGVPDLEEDRPALDLHGPDVIAC